MSYLEFEKSELVNLEYALSRELIRSNRAGSYASTTIIGCNTRKYHGLLVCPLEEMDGEHHVLLSTLDATIIQHEKEFNLGIHKYEGDNYLPKGHKYVRDFDATKGSFISYRVGGVVLNKEMLLVSEAEQVLIRYTLEEAHSDTVLRLKPFLAFRNFHALSKTNPYANTHFEEAGNGIISKLYEGYPGLYMQTSKSVDFVPVPDWYLNVEYMEEQKRGYDFKEDLYVPGYFEMPIKKGETIIFSASTKEVSPGGLHRKYNSELNLRLGQDSFRQCLLNSAQQFVVRTDKSTEIKAGFHWYSTWGRDTFMALPGLTFTTGAFDTAFEIIDSMVVRMQNGLFPSTVKQGVPAFKSVDAPLWFIWSLQQFQKYNTEVDVWAKYGKAIKSVLETYRDGSSGMIRMMDNGLIHAEEPGRAVTWMDAVFNGQPVTQRAGVTVEVNGLWYHAVCSALELAGKRDKKFRESWKELPGIIRDSYIDYFWNEEKGYLADYVNGDFKDLSVRPNQVIPVAMDFSPLTVEMKKSILDVVESELLTPRGLRSLSPKNIAYEGTCGGDEEMRGNAFHQGTAWPWMLEHFAKGYLDVHKKSGHNLIKRLYMDFENVLSEHGIGSISQAYDGNPPHDARGTISQAISVASLLRIGEMIEQFN